MGKPSPDAIDARITGHWTLDDERWASHRREHELEHRVDDTADKYRDTALSVASANLETYKQTANEFRATIADQANRFVTREEHQLVLGQLAALRDDRLTREAAEKVARESAVNEKEKERNERARSQWVAGIVIGFVSILFSALLSLVLRGAS